MAWLSSNSFTPTAMVSHTMFNNLANDIRNWGGDVNGGGYRLVNVQRDFGWLHVLGSNPNNIGEIARFQATSDSVPVRSFITIYTTDPLNWTELSVEDVAGLGPGNGLSVKMRNGADPANRVVHFGANGKVYIGPINGVDSGETLQVTGSASFVDGTYGSVTLAPGLSSQQSKIVMAGGSQAGMLIQHTKTDGYATLQMIGGACDYRLFSNNPIAGEFSIFQYSSATYPFRITAGQHFLLGHPTAGSGNGVDRLQVNGSAIFSNIGINGQSSNLYKVMIQNATSYPEIYLINSGADQQHASGSWCGVRVSNSTTSGSPGFAAFTPTAGGGMWMGSAAYAYTFAQNSMLFATNAANGFVFATSWSSEKMRITGTGVGIGNSAPAVLLDVSGPNVPSAGQLRISSTDFPQITFYNSSALVVNTTNRKASITYDLAASLMSIQNFNGGVFGPLLLNPGGGNVGVNNSAPAYALDVTGDLRVTGNIYGINLAGQTPWRQNIDAAGYSLTGVSSLAVTGAASAASLTVSGLFAGNTIGLTATIRPVVSFLTTGQTARARVLQAVGGSRVDLNTNMSFDGTSWNRDDIAIASASYVQNAGNHYFNTMAAGANPGTLTTIVTLLTTGKVGINQTAPAFALDVTGDIRATNTMFAVLSNTNAVEVTGTRPSATFTYVGSTAKGRVFAPLTGARLDISTNLLYTGTAWTHDDTTLPCTLYVQAAGNHTFYTAPAGADPAGLTTIFQILPTGMVGINKGAPTYACDVVGDVNVTGTFRVNGVAINTGLGGGQTPWTSNIDAANYSLSNLNLIHMANNSGNANLVFHIDAYLNDLSFIARSDTSAVGGAFSFWNAPANTAPIQRFRIDPNGSASFYSYVSFNENVYFRAGGVGAGAWYATASVDRFFAGMDGGIANFRIWCVTAATNSLSVDGTTGFVGIGIGANVGMPASRLSMVHSVYGFPVLGQLKGTLLITDAGRTWGMQIGAQSDGSGWIQCQRQDGGATAYNLYLQSAGGFVSIGGVAPSVALHVQGEIRATSTITGNILTSSTYVYAGTHINTPADVTAGTPSHYAVQVSSDNWIRWMVAPTYNTTHAQFHGGAKFLMWKNPGIGHTIFDASNSTSPTGSAVDPTNSQIAWTASYPTLMGWNGGNTFGVRVDMARYSDTCNSANWSANCSGNAATASNASNAYACSGNAASATNVAWTGVTGKTAWLATAPFTIGAPGNSYNTSQFESGFYDGSNVTGAPLGGTGWSGIINVNHSGYGSWGWQIGIDSWQAGAGAKLAYRSKDGANAWAGWKQLVTNDVGQTWNINISGTAQVANTIQGLGLAVDQGWPGAWQIIWCSSDGHVRLGNNTHVQGSLYVNGALNMVGYINATYINTSPGVENPAIANFFVDNGDGYIRKGNLAHIKATLGITSGGTYMTKGAANQGTFSVAGTGAAYSAAALEIRETNFAGAVTGQAYYPRIGFHHSGMVASSIAMEDTGRIAIMNNPGTGYEAFVCGNQRIEGSLFITGASVTMQAIPTGAPNIYGRIYRNANNLLVFDIVVAADEGTGQAILQLSPKKAETGGLVAEKVLSDLVDGEVAVYVKDSKIQFVSRIAGVLRKRSLALDVDEQISAPVLM